MTDAERKVLIARAPEIKKALIRCSKDDCLACGRRGEHTANCYNVLSRDAVTLIGALEEELTAERVPVPESEYRETLKRALETFGSRAQTMMVFEEMAELQKELCKFSRGAENVPHIAEEIADVAIMLEQMMILHDCEDAVEKQRNAKVRRLRERLEELG